MSHKTGYLYQFNGSESADGIRAPRESWHRTWKGALAAKAANGHRGEIFRLTGDDSSEKVG